MTIKQIRKKKDENIILGVEKKKIVFSSFWPPPSSPLSLSFLSYKKT
jgi:hypothetical protein